MPSSTHHDPAARADAWPRPFHDRPWRGDVRDAAHALWAWHAALHRPRHPALDGDDLTAYFTAQEDRALRGEAVEAVPPDVWAAVRDACGRHDVPFEDVARQLRGARRRLEPLRFATDADVRAFQENWSMPHARALARLAGVTSRRQQAYVHELARGFFWAGRLMELPHDLAADRCFVPLDDLEAAGVTVARLKEGRRDADVEKVLWKQVIRARDAFAQGLPLVHELPRRPAAALKRWWLGGLEVLNLVERRGGDVWSSPVRLSGWTRLQVRFQARFGRTTFRAR